MTIYKCDICPVEVTDKYKLYIIDIDSDVYEICEKCWKSYNVAFNTWLKARKEVMGYDTNA